MKITDNQTPEFLEKIFSTKKMSTIDGDMVDIDSGIQLEEAKMIVKAINKYKPKTTLEVGLAMGFSAYCFAKTASLLNGESIHYAIDPNQFKEWKGIGFKLIQDSKLESNFKLLEGKTHEVFHNLLDNKVELDMAFIDGWHTFDYTLVDFFFIDKILKKDGIIAFHDMYGLSKQKVLKFILTHRDYRIMNEYMIKENDKLKTFKFFIWRLLKNPMLLFSKFHWVYQTRSPYGIIFIQKKSSFEPNFDFYKNF